MEFVFIPDKNISSFKNNQVKERKESHPKQCWFCEKKCETKVTICSECFETKIKKKSKNRSKT